MSYSCIHCGQTGLSSSHSYDNCPAVLQKKQNEILQKGLDLQKKELNRQRKERGEKTSSEKIADGVVGLGGSVIKLSFLKIKYVLLFPFYVIYWMGKGWIKSYQKYPKPTLIATGLVFVVAIVSSILDKLAEGFSDFNNAWWWVLPSTALLILIVGVLIAYIFVPSFRQKIKSSYQEGEQVGYEFGANTTAKIMGNDEPPKNL